jgi:ABC-2 type transport system ATP-binding protein
MVNSHTIAVSVKNLQKTFNTRDGSVMAVRGVNLTVRHGQVFGFLGTNGAGKTTTLRMLTTLLPIDSGTATVAGFDVKQQPHEVRKHLGYVSQQGGADSNATAREDLMVQAQLYGMTKKEAAVRADELFAAFDLGAIADRPVSTYSGGQRRRLDIMLGIIHRPPILFLDEPTTGLDPQSRAVLWGQIRQLKKDGTTIFLTTHYLDEVDALADEIAIMDKGRVVSTGTPRALKKQVSGDIITLTPVLGSHTIEQVQKFIASQEFVREVKADNGSLQVYVNDGATALPQMLSFLDGKEIQVGTVSMDYPSLDDVFLQQISHSSSETTLNANKRN